MSTYVSRKTKSPSERLREKLYIVEFSENISQKKRSLSVPEFKKLAHKIRESFRNENTPRPKPAF